MQDAKDQLADAEEELEDAKKREQKQRSQLLDELSQVQQEVRHSFPSSAYTADTSASRYLRSKRSFARNSARGRSKAPTRVRCFTFLSHYSHPYVPLLQS